MQEFIKYFLAFFNYQLQRSFMSYNIKITKEPKKTLSWLVYESDIHRLEDIKKKLNIQFPELIRQICDSLENQLENNNDKGRGN